MKDLNQQAIDIYLETLRAIDPEQAILAKVKVMGETLFVSENEINLSDYSEIKIIGFGKASIKMGEVMEGLLGDRVSEGLLISDRRHVAKLKSEVIVAGHPFPDHNSLRAGRQVISLVESCGSDSLIVFLVSGGGSSLVEMPISPDITLDDLRAANSVLVNCGATIREINTVRKRLSRIKGGRLGHLASRCRFIALYISDVNPGEIDTIASSPLIPDKTAKEEIVNVIDKYNLVERLPASIGGVLKSDQLNTAPQTDKAQTEPPIHLLLLDNQDAVSAGARAAEKKGYQVEIDSDFTECHYTVAADGLIDKLIELQDGAIDKDVCLISGGEVSCPVEGDGIGGRNQEFVLYSALRLAELGRWAATAVLSCGTDGIDGNSNCAGAVAGAQVIRASGERSTSVSDFLHRNDSHSFFKQFGGLVHTGPTGNNVRDLRILLASRCRT